MRLEIAAGWNWRDDIVDAIEEAEDGDVIVVLSQNVKELAERAKARMCPDKKITFEVKGMGE